MIIDRHPGRGIEHLFDIEDVARQWHWLRLTNTSLGLVVALTFAVLWAWPTAYIVVALLGIIWLNAFDHLRNPGRSSIPSMLVDVTVIGMIMLTINIEGAGLVATLTYMLVVPALVLPWRRALPVMVYATAWTAIAMQGFDVMTVTPAVSPEVINIVVAVIFTGHTVAFVSLQARNIARSHRAKDQFLGSVSHEIRTPLTSILGWAQLLRDSTITLGTVDKSDALKSIEREAIAIAHLVDDLLATAQLSAGLLVVQEQSVDLATELRTVLASGEFDQYEPIEVRGSASPTLSDPKRVRQIIRNLLTNAVCHGGPEKWIGLSNTGTHCILTVSDNGPGIPQDVQHRVFDPYLQINAASRSHQALGLGLYTSRNLAQLMGGDLHYSRISNVSVFTLTLAIAPFQEPAATEPTSTSYALSDNIAAIIRSFAI